jgi:O-antigen/teichoic acid export membrane protein
VFYAVASTLASLLVIVICVVRFGTPRIPRSITVREVSSGLPYSLGQGIFSVQDNIDKPFLVRYGFASDAGVYGIAYRVVIMAMLPVRALLQASNARFFAIGRDGLAATASYARRLAVPAALYSLAAGCALIVCAPVLPRIVGSSYREAASALQWLALLPLCRALSYFPGDALTGAGRHGQRVRCMVASAALNVAMNVWLIPAYSWRGAAIATYVAEVSLVALLWSSLVRALHRQQDGATPEASTTRPAKHVATTS